MDLIKKLLSIFLESDLGKKLKPILDLLISNNFDFSKVLSTLDLNTLMPLFSAFSSNDKNCSVEVPTEHNEVFSSIQPFACQNIVEALNQYCY